MFENIGISRLEDYVIELGENGEEFQKVMLELLGDSKRTRNLLKTMRDLWIECNVLRRIAIFLRQSFADRVSRATLTNAKDKNSKLARSIVPIDIVEALGVKKGTEGRVSSIEDLVMTFIDRETMQIQKMDQKMGKIDSQMLVGLYDANKVETLWGNVRLLVLERLTKSVLRKRNNLANQKLREWIDGPEPELTLEDLQEHSRSRIDNVKELLELENAHKNFTSPEDIVENFAYATSYFNKIGQTEVEVDEPKTLGTVRATIWNPSTWLHQKQLIDDFIFFSIMNDLCMTNKKKIAFNLR